MSKSSIIVTNSADLIKKRIKSYLLEKETNYAYMIAGEWGIGKTYFLKNKLIPHIRNIALPKTNLKYRPIYISLSGVKDMERLEELMFSRINIQTQTPRTLMDKEIELLKNVVDEQDLTPLIRIPSTIVFCFDDLERIATSFLEEALGFINSYIEHGHTKVVFLCDETRIQEKTKERYRLIKEKYISFTIEYEPNFEKFSNATKSLDKNEKKLVDSIFKRGLCYNLRILEYALKANRYVLLRFNGFKINNLEQNDISQIRRLLIFYTTFFSIEYKRGNLPFKLIKEIQLPNRLLSPTERRLQVDLSETFDDMKKKDVNYDEQRKQNLKEESESAKIKALYFDGNFEPFEPFESVADYLRSGCLNVQKLSNEIEAIINSLKKRKGTEEENTLKKIQNILDLSDETYLKDISQVLESVDKGNFSIGTYLQIYSGLLSLESYEIAGINVDESITERFKEAMTKSVNSEIEKDPWFKDRLSSLWPKREESVQAEKYQKLLTFADEIIKKITKKEKESKSITEILQFIENNDYDKLKEILVNKKRDYVLNEENANKIYSKLIEQKAILINNFRFCLKERYELRDSQTPASYEYPFIKKMIELIEEYEKQKNNNRPISYIPFIGMKNDLKECISYFRLDKE
jgi:hypothetical protein